MGFKSGSLTNRAYIQLSSSSVWSNISHPNHLLLQGTGLRIEGNTNINKKYSSTSSDKVKKQFMHLVAF